MNIELKFPENLTDEEMKTVEKLVKKAKVKKSKVFKPKHGELYYYLVGTAVNARYWLDKFIDKDRYSVGNCFETREQATFAAEKQKVYAELKRYALEHNEEEIDWENRFQNKYCLFYDHKGECIKAFGYCISEELGQIYFTSEQIARNAVKEIGEDRIKKYLFETE